LRSTKLFEKNRVPMKKRKKARRAGWKKYHSEMQSTFYGSLGAASPVRKIDPTTGEVTAIIPAK
jgi:hypothetical protein